MNIIDDHIVLDLKIDEVKESKFRASKEVIIAGLLGINSLRIRGQPLTRDNISSRLLISPFTFSSSFIRSLSLVPILVTAE